MVGYRNSGVTDSAIAIILSGIPMVGYRNVVVRVDVAGIILSGIPMVGYRNEQQYAP